MKNKNLTPLDNKKSLMEFLRQPTIKIAEVLTGVLISDTKDWKLSTGKIVQSFIKGNLFTQLGREIEKYQKEGRIKEDYFANNKNQVSLFELLKFIDEAPEEELLKAAKSIFFTSISKEASEQDEILGYEFLQTIKKLSGTEILILKANFEIATRKSITGVNLGGESREGWLNIISQQMGYGGYSSMVEKYENNLIASGFISVITHSDRSGFRSTNHFRLTSFGYKFCEFILNYSGKIKS